MIPTKLHDPELQMIAEQLARIEDRLGAGTGPVVESPEIAIVELLRVVRSLIEHLDDLDRRFHENRTAAVQVESDS